MNHKILIVDDEPANLRLLERLFRAQYQVVTAPSGVEALELLGRYDIAVIISDQRMPGMTGIEFFKRAAQLRQHTVRIILTGYTDVNALVEAINSGVVYKYVPKPWSNEDLLQTVARGLEHYETNKRQHELMLHNQRISARLKATERSFVRLIAETLDIKDEYAHNHARRVANYAKAIGHRLNLEPEEFEQLELAAYLHEAANIGVSDKILPKTADATGEEDLPFNNGFERGIQILASAPIMNEVAPAVRHHQEHFDGKGSPDNLSDEQIPLLARVVAVACAYDEMTAPRDFEQYVPHEEAVEQLQNNSGKQFDPHIVQVFSQLKSIGLIRDRINEGFTGICLLPSRIFTDPKKLSTAELLQKFKTEPMLAIDILKLANVQNGDGEITRLMTAMSSLGEAKLRLFVEQNGLPAADAKFDAWSARAVRRAVVAQLLAAHTNIIDPEEAYTLGLLYDVGEILLGNLFPEEFRALEKIDDEKIRSERQIELFGFDSIQISQWMLEAAGLPPEKMSAVRIYNELMHINNPIALLLHTAHKIAGKNELNKPSGEIVGADCVSVLRLTCAELYQIYERANAISENRTEILQEA